MKTKRNTIIAIICLIAMLIGMIGCAKTEDEGPDDIPIQLVPAGDVIDKYSKDDTDYSALPEEQTKIVRLHYRRNDDTLNDRSSYQAWNVWAWDMTNGGNGAAYEFTGYDDYGVYVDLDLNVISGGKEIGKLGFIVRTDNWAKDPDGDRSIDVAEVSHGGVQNVYVRTSESTVFDTQDNACKSIVSYAMMRSSNRISVFPGTNFFEGSSSVMFLMMPATSYPSAVMVLYFGSRAKLISINCSYLPVAKCRMDSVFPICLAPFTIRGL